MLCLGGLRPSPVLIGISAFFFLFASPIATASSSTIWQLKVPPALHGRVFAMRRMITTLSLPVGYLLAGPLADYVFEPLLEPSGAWSATLGRLFGVGPGRGIGVMFFALGIGVLALAAVASQYGPLRRLEQEIPDAPTGELETRSAGHA